MKLYNVKINLGSSFKQTHIPGKKTNRGPVAQFRNSQCYIPRPRVIDPLLPKKKNFEDLFPNIKGSHFGHLRSNPKDAPYCNSTSTGPLVPRKICLQSNMSYLGCKVKSQP